MQVSSELPQAADSAPPAFVCVLGQLTERPQVEDEEFPSDLPGDYDWVLQPASQFNSKRVTSFVAVMVTIVLIAASVFIVHALSNPSPSVLASPSSPLR